MCPVCVGKEGKTPSKEKKKKKKGKEVPASPLPNRPGLGGAWSWDQGSVGGPGLGSMRSWEWGSGLL